MRFLDEEQRQQIGYSFIMDNLELVTPYGLKEKKNIKPYTLNQRSILIEELNKLEEAIKLEKNRTQVISDIKYIFMKIKDIILLFSNWPSFFKISSKDSKASS